MTESVKESVKETVTMYATRKIGKNIFNSNLSCYVDYVQEHWCKEGEEVVVVEIRPYEPEPEPDEEEEKEIIDIQVCSHCKRASCWQGIFPCGRYRRASTIYKVKEELERMALEDPVYWKTNKELAKDERCDRREIYSQKSKYLQGYLQGLIDKRNR